MRTVTIAVALGMSLMAMAATRLDAQIGFESAIKDVDDIRVFASCWNPKNEIFKIKNCGIRDGFGLEVSYNLPKLSLSRLGVPDSTAHADVDSTVEVTERSGQRERKVIYHYAKAATIPRLYIEPRLTLGYSQFSGFDAVGDSTFSLRGTVRELPSVNLYGVLGSTFGLGQYFHPYGVLSTGLIQLNSATIESRLHPDIPLASDTVTNYSAPGTSFQIGAGLGAELRWQSLGVFYERMFWAKREFPSVQWTASGSAQAPGKFPQRLDFGGDSWVIGVVMGVHLGDSKPSK